ncbi:unnamed protein product [Soboliphyme baturini]|uniref:ERAP1_C domain-containing protein n=1 Tax=Soboliphyme baturini TaxID=241478 RepID=A0A183JAW6_9BILA|nr:unnamed protein product [Soboliphyme baturini]
MFALHKTKTRNILYFRGGVVSYELALNLTRYLENERQALPWMAFKTTLDYLISMTFREKDFIFVRAYFLKLLKPTFANIELDKDEYMKNIIFSLASTFDYPPAVAMADLLFTNFSKSCNDSYARSSTCSSVPPYIRKQVYCLGVSKGAYDAWNFMWNLYKKEEQEHERQYLLYGLSCTHQPYLIDRRLVVSQSLSPQNESRMAVVSREAHHKAPLG